MFCARIEHRSDDFAITSAAAEHATDCIHHVGFGWLRTAIEKRRSRHLHPGRADATLGRAVAKESALEARGVARILFKPLYRQNVATFDLPHSR